MKVITAYEQCNLVTRSNKVPFPMAEFIMMSIFMFMCIAGLFFLTGLTQPRAKVIEIRRWLRIREQLSLTTSGLVPDMIKRSLDDLRCLVPGPDVLKILSFSFVALLFIMNAVLVTNFQQSTVAYKSSIDMVSANICI